MSATQFWMLVSTMIAATVLAGVGGELFVRAVVGIAQRWRLPKLLVAMTIAACATSAPELTVAIVASSGGNSALAMGDALGSNVTNILLILGTALLFGHMSVKMETLRWHLISVVTAPLVTLALLSDGALSRVEGGLLLLGFLTWLVLTVVGVRRARLTMTESADPAKTPRPRVLFILLVGGVAILAVAGHLFVQSGRTVALLFGLPDAAVGATVVALGTSMPELMTTLVSRWRGHEDVGLGTLLGSNIFNGLAILGTAALIAPIVAPLWIIWVMLLFGVLSIVLIIPRRGCLSRVRGGFLLCSYSMYVAALVAMLDFFGAD